MRRVKFKSKEAQNLYDKSFEVMDLIDNIIDIIPPENELQVQMGRQMIDNAMCIIPKIGGAEAGKLYDIRMESAALIRYYAKAILDATTMLEAFDYE